MKTATLVIALALASAALTLRAQDAGGPPPPRDEVGAGAQSGPGGDHKRPVPPVMVALDLNADGVIDAGEISKASESLKKLDKNGDGKLTPDECRPPRPERAARPEGQADQGPAHEQGQPPPPAAE